MKKEYTIKFYVQRDGQRSENATELDRLQTYAFSNKEAFQAGRARLAKMAEMYVIDYDGADDDSSLEHAKDNLESLLDGSINTYCEDVYTYFFRVFSKKAKELY
jgi:hypothetical protein